MRIEMTTAAATHAQTTGTAGTKKTDGLVFDSEKIAKEREERLKNVPQKVRDEYKMCRGFINDMQARYRNDWDCKTVIGYNNFGDPMLGFSTDKMKQKMSNTERKYYNDCINKVKELIQKYPELLSEYEGFNPENGKFYFKWSENIGKPQTTASADEAQEPQETQETAQETQPETPAKKKGFTKTDKWLMRLVGLPGSIVAEATPDSDEGGSKIAEAGFKAAARAPFGILGYLFG